MAARADPVKSPFWVLWLYVLSGRRNIDLIALIWFHRLKAKGC